MTDHTSMETQMRASNVSASLFDMEENFLNGNLEDHCKKIEEYIGGLPRFAEGDGLERTRKLLKLLSVWKCEIPKIHVAGTNGKGSTCAYLQSLFMGHGYKVGGFISPHLVTMRERFLIDKKPVCEEMFAKAFQKVYRAAAELENEKKEYPTFLEFLFAMGMVIFNMAKVDLIVLETGLGGRLDATNVYDKTDVCVLTSIGLDHCKILGDTKEKIAAEKAGIIKDGSDVVFIDTESGITDVFMHAAHVHHANVNKIDKSQFYVEKIKHKNIDFSYKSSYYNYISLTLSTYALYQVDNATLALRAYEAFCMRHELAPMPIEEIQNAMQHTFWECRMEEVDKDIFFDGAHNEDGIRAFLQSVKAIPCQGKRILCFSAVNDKDYQQMITLLCESGLFSEAVAIDMEIQRGLGIETLQRYFSHFNRMNVYYERGVQNGINRCLCIKTDADQVFIVGSLYLVGLIKTVFRRKDND